MRELNAEIIEFSLQVMLVQKSQGTCLIIVMRALLHHVINSFYSSKIIFNITIIEQLIYLYFQLLGATGYIMNCIQQNTHSTILRFMCSDTTFGPISLTGTLTSTSVLFPKRIFMQKHRQKPEQIKYLPIYKVIATTLKFVKSL